MPAAAKVNKVDVLIGFNNTPGQTEHNLVKSFGGAIKHSYRIVPAVSASIPESAIAGLSRHPLVTVVEMDGEVQAIGFEEELDNTWGVKRISAGQVHSSGSLGAGVGVAVIDSGFDYTHPELSGVFAGGYDFVNGDSDPMDDNGHGTHVAGTVAAARDGDGVVGASPSAMVYGLKTLSASGSGSWSFVVAALDWAAENGVKVTNNSYGASQNPGSIVQAAFDNTYQSGMLHIAAAGNAGNCGGKGNSVGYPARFASVMAVAATNQNDARPCWSSTGPDVEISSPGSGINSTLLGGGYGTMSGTSMASPHVAGTAALVIAAGETNNAAVRNILNSTADPLGNSSYYGSGMVNAVSAVAAVGGEPPPPPEEGIASVSSIAYSVSGGRSNDKHLNTALTVKDNNGNPVAGAVVSIVLSHDSGSSWNSNGTTGSSGEVMFTLKNALGGCYGTTVTNISASGLAWDGITPENSFCK